ncbi:inositol monophosphatase [Robbsia sp. KACC 23696]|uniref:inositol monophosphatase family protein n=1 Tax=Robbsia sp. KACC 23696 TaxID=3149231 RepID=UPI00325B6986
MNQVTPMLQTAQRLAAAATLSARDDALLAAMVATVRVAGAELLRHFDEMAPPPADPSDIVRAIEVNDALSLDIVRGLLEQARPKAGWVEDELAGGALPAGEWWLVDPVEGNINHVQGIAQWGVSATLIRDNVPVLTAIYEPVAGRLYTAARGHGAAYANGVPMRVSQKTALSAAILSTGQARPGEGTETHRRIGASVTAMLDAALVVRTTVPATFELAHVAAGRIDGFWQYSNVRSGQAAGALLVAEAGGVVSDIHGRPWTLASDDFLVCAPGIHRAFLDALDKVR